MKRVLVTGGAGFLGSHIADALTARGYRVTIFDRVDAPFQPDEQEFIRGGVCVRRCHCCDLPRKSANRGGEPTCYPPDSSSIAARS
jgi:nucleoside-diphosphate-sugar epimerase